MNEFKHNITLAKTGQNVTFYEADGFDKKKNKQVKNAVNIYLNGAELWNFVRNAVQCYFQTKIMH